MVMIKLRNKKPLRSFAKNKIKNSQIFVCFLRLFLFKPKKTRTIPDDVLKNTFFKFKKYKQKIWEFFLKQKFNNWTFILKFL